MDHASIPPFRPTDLGRLACNEGRPSSANPFIAFSDRVSMDTERYAAWSRDVHSWWKGWNLEDGKRRRLTPLGDLRFDLGSMDRTPIA
jgi:hypothetical protein